MNGSCLISGSCLTSGSYLISGSCLTSGELSGSRLIRFERGGAARAFLHVAHLSLRLPWGHFVRHTEQLSFRLPLGQGLHAAQ